ncbi:MAG: lipopolysaccharide heptosyltransferase II [Gammaproteobacteria bacterium]
MRKALVVGPSWVGDMVMAQTLFKVLKANDPNILIDILAPDWSRPLTARMPEVHDAIAMPVGHGALELKKRWQISRSLRAEQYDEAYVLPNSFKSALVPFLTGIPKRVGWRGEWRYGVLNTVHILDKAQYPLMIERFIALGFPKHAQLPKPLPLPSLVRNEQNLEQAKLKFNLSTDLPILVLCPGAEFGPSKRWPEHYYADVAKRYLEKGWQVWLFGSVKDASITSDIQNITQHQCVNLAGKTSLAEAIDLMSLADLVVSNDSGLMHIGAALGRPLIAIYGSTDPTFTPPLGQKVQIVRTNESCSPCFKRTCPLNHHACMQRLKPMQVLAACEALTI